MKMPNTSRMRASEYEKTDSEGSLALHLFPRHPKVAPISPVRLTCFNEEGKVVKAKAPVRIGFFRRFGKWATALLGSNNEEESSSEQAENEDESSGDSGDTSNSEEGGADHTPYFPCTSFYSNDSPNKFSTNNTSNDFSSKLKLKLKTTTITRPKPYVPKFKVVRLPESKMLEHIKKTSPEKCNYHEVEDRRTQWKKWCKSKMKNSLCGVSEKSKNVKKVSTKSATKKSPGKLEEERKYLSWGKFDGSYVIETRTFYGNRTPKGKDDQSSSEGKPVRKSQRKTARRVQFELRQDIINKIKSKCQDGIKVRSLMI